MISLSNTIKKGRCPYIANYFLLMTGCTSFAQYRVTCSACGIRSISKDVKTRLYDFNCFVTSKKRMASACKHLSSCSGTTFNFKEAFLRSLADKCLGTIHILRKHLEGGWIKVRSLLEHSCAILISFKNVVKSAYI